MCDLNQRELNVVLLIIRVTVGCGTDWAKIRNTDLQIIGISDSHAKDVVEGMLTKGIILRNEKIKAYRLSPAYFDTLQYKNEILFEKLGKLIGKHLPKTSRNGKANVSKIGGEVLPKEEAGTSQFRKSHLFPRREDLGSHNTGFQPMKEILNIDR